jgi:hypothetical protein
MEIKPHPKVREGSWMKVAVCQEKNAETKLIIIEFHCIEMFCSDIATNRGELPQKTMPFRYQPLRLPKALLIQSPPRTRVSKTHIKMISKAPKRHRCII